MKKLKMLATSVAAVATFSIASAASAAPLNLAPPADANVPTASDLIGSAWSFASGFWEFALLGLAIILAPWLFSIMRAALGKRKSA